MIIQGQFQSFLPPRRASSGSNRLKSGDIVSALKLQARQDRTAVFLTEIFLGECFRKSPEGDRSENTSVIGSTEFNLKFPKRRKEDGASSSKGPFSKLGLPPKRIDFTKYSHPFLTMKARLDEIDKTNILTFCTNGS